MIYHGPVEEAAAYFETLGFRCPERKGVADFLQEVTSKKVGCFPFLWQKRGGTTWPPVGRS